MKIIHSVIISLILLLSATTAHSATYYFHNDHLGTPQVLTDENQAVVWKGTYDPFGQVTETVATVEQNLRFPGQYLDRESGLHYNYFRTYDPNTGRYTQSDPIGLGWVGLGWVGLGGGVNTYAYVGGNPSSYTDPYGLWANFAVGLGIRVMGGRAAGAAISRAMQQSIGPAAGTALACILTGYCSASEDEANENSEESEQCPPLPEDFQGSNPVLGKGRTITDAPENETAEEIVR